jgi:hypothetical protein
VSGPLLLPTWEQLGATHPQLVDTMGRYLQQIACVLRPGSVNGADLALRSFTSFLVQTSPAMVSTADITRRHVEDYKPWLAQRPGQNKVAVDSRYARPPLGTLRMFFVRIEEWGWNEAPARVPMFSGDLPRQDHPLPKALDDAAAAKLRHTLATQAINRGMSLEAIAAMLGHRSLDMTLRYAKIANRTVADEYFAVTDKVEALYGQPQVLPADAIGPKMARLRREHHRLLGNGYCTRPPELDCAFESICETCAFFQTSIAFRPTLQAQHDDDADKGQNPPRTTLRQAARQPQRQRSIMNPLTPITHIMPMSGRSAV